MASPEPEEAATLPPWYRAEAPGHSVDAALLANPWPLICHFSHPLTAAIWVTRGASAAGRPPVALPS